MKLAVTLTADKTRTKSGDTNRYNNKAKDSESNTKGLIVAQV